MDPLCIFSSPFAVNKATNPFSVILVCLGLGVLVGGTFIFGMLWCVRICPLSGLAGHAVCDAEGALDQIDCECALAKVQCRAPRVLRRRRLAHCSPFGRAGSERRDIATVTRCCVLPAPCRRIVLPGCASAATTACTPARRKSFTRIPVMKRALAGFGAPVVQFDRDYEYCLETCNACTQVCPTGALTALDSAEEKQVHHRRSARR